MRNEWGKAAEDLRKASAINPSSAQYYYVLAVVYRKLGKPKESMAVLDIFQRLKRESDLLDHQVRDAHEAFVHDSKADKTEVIFR
jgi:uncharacterized protein HemY